MRKLPRCNKGTNGEPCGNARPGPKTVDQCSRCWIRLYAGTVAQPAIAAVVTSDKKAGGYDPPLRNPACERLSLHQVIDRRGESCVHKWIVGCDLHGQCTTGVVVDGVANCRMCNDYKDPSLPDPVAKPYFDRVVLINLKRRTDRIEAFRLRQASHGWELPEPEIFRAVEGNAVGVPSWYHAGGGAFGCRESHVRVLQDALMDGVERLLVLEDDVTWMDGPDGRTAWQHLADFMATVPDDWEQLMLGGQHIQHPLPFGRPGIVKCINCQRTHAYAIKRSAMQDLLKVWYSCNTHIDHRMGPWQGRRNVYAPERFIFGQAASKSDISGWNNPDKFWVPPVNQQTIIHLTAPKSVVASLRSRGFHTGHDREPVTDLDKGLVRLAETSGAVRESMLRKWVETLTWEAESSEGSVAVCWHPNVTADELRAVHVGEVAEIVGDTVEDVLDKVPSGVRLKANYAASHIVLLRADRQAAEGARKAGFHLGNWRCRDSGHDHGLQRISLLNGPPRLIELSGWVESVAREALAMEGGVAVVWHPAFTAEQVRHAAGGRKVVEIDAKTAFDVVRIFREKM